MQYFIGKCQNLEGIFRMNKFEINSELKVSLLKLACNTFCEAWSKFLAILLSLKESRREFFFLFFFNVQLHFESNLIVIYKSFHFLIFCRKNWLILRVFYLMIDLNCKHFIGGWRACEPPLKKRSENGKFQKYFKNILNIIICQFFIIFCSIFLNVYTICPIH